MAFAKNAGSKNKLDKILEGLAIFFKFILLNDFLSSALK